MDSIIDYERDEQRAWFNEVDERPDDYDDQLAARNEPGYIPNSSDRLAGAPDDAPVPPGAPW